VIAIVHELIIDKLVFSVVALIWNQGGGATYLVEM